MKNLHLFLYRNAEKITIVIAAVLSLASFIYFYNQNLITAYGDAKSHLNISRRVIDNIQPGAAQFGGVWLPLLHVLMLPTIWIDFFWHSGVSGSIVSMPTYVLSVILIYKIIFLLQKSKLQAFLGSLSAMINLNLLYMQTTPMTESLFIFTLAATVYFLIKWTIKDNLTDLIFAAFFVVLSTVNRYEGWSFALASSISVLFISFVKTNKKKAESRFLIFSSLAFLGVFFWLLWQLAIFHNPLYFLNSDFSSKGQTMLSIKEGLVPTYHNPLISFLADSLSLVHVLGVWTVGLALISLCYFLSFKLSHGVKKKDLYYLPLVILAVPFIFLGYAIYNGNVPINVPEVVGPNVSLKYFNVRYALYTLPLVAIFIGLLPKNKILTFIIITALIINTHALSQYGEYGIATLADAKEAELQEIVPAAEWMKNNYKGGNIIVSAAVGDPFIFRSEIAMRNFITEGSGKYWNESRSEPSKYANYIVVVNSPRDMVSKYFSKSEIEKQFRLASSHGAFKIYVKKG